MPWKMGKLDVGMMFLGVVGIGGLGIIVSNYNISRRNWLRSWKVRLKTHHNPDGSSLLNEQEIFKKVFGEHCGHNVGLGRYNLGRKAFKIIQDMDRLMEEKSSINWTNNPTPLEEVNNASLSTPFSDYKDFESRKPIYKKALNALKADIKPHMIALCGMGGVRKTTMMKKLHKVVRENKMFDFIIEVAIGENIEVSVIQKVVATEQLTIDLNESTKEARAGKLHNGFKTKVDRCERVGRREKKKMEGGGGVGHRKG